MKKLFFLFLSVCGLSLYSQGGGSKGAIIIASVEGQVSVVNNDTQEPLPSDQIKAGGLIFDGHTIKTGPSSKIILLMSNGTVSTVKSDSSLNIKKFIQEKFDPGKKKLSEMKGEPSSSDTVIDLELGDMILDVKRLNKKSSFNIESPVGTAGIRGTIPYFQVTQTPDGGFNQVTSMARGELSFMPKGASTATLLGPGQSLSIGIGSNGVLLPPTLGQVPTSLLASIEADIEASGDITGVSSAEDTTTPSIDGDQSEEEVPSEEELNEADDSRGAAAKGVDDNSSSEAVAMDKAGLIDLDDEDQLSKVDTYVEVSQKASNKLDDKIQERRSGRRNAGKGEDEFISDLTGNFDDVVDVTVEAEALDIKDEAMFDSLLESSENAADVKEVVSVAAEIGAKDKESLESVFKNVDQADAVKEVVSVAAEIGAKDKENLGSVLKNADKAEDLKEVVSVASEIGAKDATNLGSVLQNADKADSLNKVMKVAKESLGSSGEDGEKKLDSSSLSILSNTLQNADKADSLAEVVEVAGEIGAQNAENLTSVFQNADKADDLKEVVAVAAEIGAKDAANLGSVLQNADKADSLNKVMKVAKESLGTANAEGEKKLDSSSLNILSNTLQNADKADSLAEVMEVAAEAGAQSAENLTSVFENADKADDLKEVVKKAAGAGASGSLGGILQKADRATDFKKVTDQLDNVSLEGGALDVFEKIETVADVFVAVAGDDEVDQDFAKNILGNTDAVEDIKEAVELVKEKGGVSDSQALMDFAKKDVTELKAINKVAEKLGDSEDALTAFVSEGIDQALQLDHAFAAGDLDADDLAGNIVSGGSFTEVVGASALNNLEKKYSGNEDYLEIISLNSARAQDISFALSFVDAGSEQEAALLANVDKIDAIMSLSNKFQDNEETLSIIYNNLDVAPALNELIRELSIYPKRLDVVMQNAELAPAILSTYKDYEEIGEQSLLDQLFSSSQNLRDTISNDGLSKLTRLYPRFAKEIETNADIAGEIVGVLDLVGEEYADKVLSNLDQFSALSVLINRTRGDAKNLSALFSHLDFVVELKELSDRYNKENVAGGQDALFGSLNLFEDDPGYFLLAQDEPKFFVRLYNTTDNLGKVSSTLAYELLELGLSRKEMLEVLADIIEGPSADGPKSQSPSDEQTQTELQNYDLMNLNLSHVIDGSIDPSLVISSEVVMASSYFEEFYFVYEELENLYTSRHGKDFEHYEQSDTLDVEIKPDIKDESSELDFQDKSYDIEFTKNDSVTENDHAKDSNIEQDSVDTDHKDGITSEIHYNDLEGILGGVELSIKSGEYDLSSFNYEAFIFAASERLSVSGEILLHGSESLTEALFLSSGSLFLEEGSMIDFTGESLGIGSFDTLDVISVDLKARDEINLGSLENLVIQNSALITTGGTGADFVHLMAFQQIDIDNLRFSEKVREISMDAMTINLMNLNFPENSMVYLQSEYGPLLGKYPNFGKSVYGRVNFIENVRYNNNLINSNASFDQFGSNIFIGKINK